MNRRAFVAGVVGGTLALAGCTTTGNTDEDPASAAERSKPPSSSKGRNRQNIQDGRITVDDVKVSPGDTGTITIMARNVSAMQVYSISKESIVLEYGNASFSPRVNTIAQSYPPYWGWESVESKATVEIPYHVPADTRSGTDKYSVSIGDDPRSPATVDTASENFTITVA